MQITEDDAYNFVMYRAGALNALVKVCHAKLHHVKPHGALYNQATKEAKLVRGIPCAVSDLGENIRLYTLAGNELVTAARDIGVPVWEEVFADRGYNSDGTPAHRSNPKALIDDEEVLRQTLSMAENGTLLAIDWSIVQVNADILCIH